MKFTKLTNLKFTDVVFAAPIGFEFDPTAEWGFNEEYFNSFGNESEERRAYLLKYTWLEAEAVFCLGDDGNYYAVVVYDAPELEKNGDFVENNVAVMWKKIRKVD